MRLYQKPSGIWAVDYVCRSTGERRRVSTGLREKPAATKLARALVKGEVMPTIDQRAEAAQRAPEAILRASSRGTSMSALWTRCENTIWHPREVRSQATLLSNLRILRVVEVDTPTGRRVFGDMDVTEVRHSTLEALAEALRGRDYAPGTVKRKVDMVGRSLTQAVKWELIAIRPAMPTIKVDNARTRVISEAEEAVVFRVVEDRAEAEPGRDWTRYGHLLRFLMDTACRLGEALAVRRDWIEERAEGWALNIPASITKNGKARTIPLSAACVAALPYLEMNAHRDGRLFPMTAGTAQYYWRVNVLPDAKELHGVDLSDAVLHTFRHTKLTRLAKLPGFGIHRVSTWAGHSDISITAGIYAKLDVGDLWAGV